MNNPMTNCIFPVASICDRLHADSMDLLQDLFCKHTEKQTKKKHRQLSDVILHIYSKREKKNRYLHKGIESKSMSGRGSVISQTNCSNAVFISLESSKVKHLQLFLFIAYLTS